MTATEAWEEWLRLRDVAEDALKTRKRLDPCGLYPYAQLEAMKKASIRWYRLANQEAKALGLRK